MENTPHITIVGHVTIDRNVIQGEETKAQGGPPTFMARILMPLSKLTIITSYGSDFDTRQLPEAVFYPSQPCGAATLRFENIYTDSTDRRQSVIFGDCPAIPDTSGIDGQIRRKQNILFVTPVIPDIDEKRLKQLTADFPDAIRVLCPQGLFRLKNEAGIIERQDWTYNQDSMGIYDVIIVSEKDGEGIAEKATDWSRQGVLVVVTKDEDGCSVYEAGAETHFATRKIPESDITSPTGAGDTFAAVFGYIYWRTGKSIAKSANTANGVAGLSLTNSLQDMNFPLR